MALKKNNNFKARPNTSYQRKLKGSDYRSGRKDPLIVFSLKNFDRNQGQSFVDWENEKILSLAIAKIQNICSLSRTEAIHQQIIKEYPKGVFPPKSDFKHPKHIPADIAWCSIHIQGKECVIGYFEDNIFYIVFLDKDHRFWISLKKNT